MAKGAMSWHQILNEAANLHLAGIELTLITQDDEIFDTRCQ
jgi:hypothetical protein